MQAVWASMGSTHQPDATSLWQVQESLLAKAKGEKVSEETKPDEPAAIATIKPDGTIAPLEEQTVFTKETEDDVFVLARYPYQMEKCQSALIEWVEKKMFEIKAEQDDMKQNVEIARERKWGMAALQRAEKRAGERVEYYQKMKLALEAGHCIVPDFPVDVFVIRTAKKKPLKNTGQYFSTAAANQSAQSLPAGEGEYKPPAPVVYSRTIDEKTKQYYAERWAQTEFPFTTAKPKILDATARAMTDKVFDEIGVLPGSRKGADPIVVGRIIHPSSTRWNKKVVTFLIAWFLDTREL